MTLVSRYKRASSSASFLLAALLVAFGSAGAMAQDPGAMFDAAVGAYQRGHFDSAATGFLKLAQGGVDDDRVWYNLGNAHFKSGRIGSALVAFRRGLELAPRDADLQANYGYVKLFAADKIEATGTFFLETWWRYLIDQLSLSESRLLAAMLFWLAALLTVWRIWPGPITRVGPALVIVAWLLWGAATGASASCFIRDVVARHGAVVTVETDVRGGPGNDYVLQFVAHDGLLGSVERTESGWHLVRFPNGLKGWIKTTDFEVI